MKKLTLLAASALATLSMNAQLYVVGTFNDFSLGNPKVVNASEDGTYTFTMNNTAKFKMSTVNSTAWDGDGGFNSGAIGYSGEMTEPGTYAIEAWGEDQTFPWYGDWTVTVSADLKTMTTSTTTAKPTSAEFYIRGDMNGWGSPANYKFKNVKGDIWGIDNVTIAAGQNFKVADAGWGSINYGGASEMAAGDVYTLTYNAGNMSVAEAYTGPVQFNLTTHEFILGTFPTEPDPEPVYTYYLANEWTGWGENADWRFAASEEEGVYTLGTVDIKANSSFVVAIATDGEFDINNKYGYAYDMEAETLYDLVKNGHNMTLANDFHGTVNLTVTDEAVTIEFVPEEIVVLTLYVIGDAVGGWSGTGVEMTPVSDNVYTVSFPAGLTAGEFKVWDGTWNYNFGGNALDLANGNNEAWFDGANFQFPAALAGHPTVLTLTIPEGSDVKDSSIGAVLNVDVDLNTGVEVIGADNSAAEYFNMQGVRVANPENGIFIVRQGGKTYKVVVK